MEYPLNWNTGFDGPFKKNPNKKQEPFLIEDRWYIYLYNDELNQEFIYGYSEDLYYLENEFPYSI
jgi:hypothetical protein